MARVFDWARLLKEQHVPYVESGPNVKRGELAIQCPYCGSADPSKHMGINLETGWWSCWRNRAQHSGKSPLRLIMKLLGVPYGKAREIAGLDADYVDPEGFDAIAARVMGRNKEVVNPSADRRFLDLDPGFIDIVPRGRARRAFEYLFHDRGFDLGADVDKLCEDYQLKFGTGRWADRIILPYFQDGKLVTWTGRAIAESTVRYRDLSLDESLLAPKETLYNHDAMLTEGKALVLVEGPFDVLKLDFYGKQFGVRAVGLSTNSIKEEQAFLLQTARGHFPRVLVMLDTKSKLGIVDSMRMKQELYFIDNLSIVPVPCGAGDAGALHPEQVIAWAETL
jgi:hypothetical protein